VRILSREEESMDSWSCLLVHKGPGMISDAVCASLKMAACKLHLDRKDRMDIFTNVCEGVIETTWDTRVVGARSGVLFRAQIGSDAGEYHVNFLLSTEDLDRGVGLLRDIEAGEAWGEGEGRVPVPDLYKFYDLRRAVSRSTH